MQNEVNHSTNVRERIQIIEETITSVIKECRSTIESGNDPLAESLLETTAKVLEGLGEAFHAYHISNVPPPDDAFAFSKSDEPWD